MATIRRLGDTNKIKLPTQGSAAIDPKLIKKKEKTPKDYNSLLTTLATYGSNAVNALRRPPLPPTPENLSPVTLRRVNLNNSRNEILRQGRIADLQTQGLDSQAAAAVRAGNFAGKLGALNSVNTQEANINAQISNQQAQMNMGVEAQNVGQRNMQQRDLVEMRIAQQANQSANLANAADKYVAIGNEKSRAQLEMDKYGVMQQYFKESGVFDRYLDEQKKKGVTDPTGINKQYKTRNSYSTGGILRRLNK